MKTKSFIIGSFISGLFLILAPSVKAANPSAPTALNAIGTSISAISLQWTAGGGQTSYKVERSAVSGDTGFSEVATPSTESCVDAGLETGEVYWYRVRASNASGNSGYTPVVAAVTRMAGTLTLSGRHILDATGQVFVPRGVERIPTDAGDMLADIDQIAASGANAARLLLTMDAVNNMTPQDYDRVIAQAISHKIVVWISLFSWTSSHQVADAFGGGTLAGMADYLPIWQRQWMKDLVSKYREWIMIDAMQEFKASGGNSFDPATQTEWATAAKNQIQAFRIAGYTEPLEIMSNYEGRDLDAIVVKADQIRAVDTVLVNGEPQTLFGWQAYWATADDWYPNSQGALLRGQRTTAAQAIALYVATRNYPIMVGLDDGFDQVGRVGQLENMPACEANQAGWLWWDWKTMLTSSSLMNDVVNLPGGLSGAVPAHTSGGDSTPPARPTGLRFQ